MLLRSRRLTFALAVVSAFNKSSLEEALSLCTFVMHERHTSTGVMSELWVNTKMQENQRIVLASSLWALKSRKATFLTPPRLLTRVFASFYPKSTLSESYSFKWGILLRNSEEV